MASKQPAAKTASGGAKKPAAATGKAAVTQKTAAEAPKDEKVQAGYPIEDGVEVPSKRTIASKYPFADMAVGQSFRTPLAGEEKALGKTEASKVARSLGSAASRYGTNNGKKFTTRVMKEEAPATGYFIRCWRLN